ncbi:MAG TPA: TnpV protein [Candidatus Fimimorpha excrementavium]|nr:TnpV protein [Candidatus Fimimorpha excrementavium]
MWKWCKNWCSNRFISIRQLWQRKHYLKEHKKAVYITLLTSGRLISYLSDIEELAQERFERIVELICN